MQFSFRHVEVGYVKKLIDSLNPKKGTGPDKISPRALTVSCEALTVPLTNLINHCITINAWPSLWKRGNVSRLYKKDNPTDKVNYRLGSVLTCFSKIFQ